MKKKKIIILSIFIIIILILLVLNFNKKNVLESNEIIQEKKVDIRSIINNETGKYEIINEITGEVLFDTDSEVEAEIELEFYQKYPDYRANPPISPNAE